jgi:hypothetical protein
MHATYSPDVNMAYIHLTEASDARSVEHTEPLIVDLPGGTSPHWDRGRWRRRRPSGRSPHGGPEADELA